MNHFQVRDGELWCEGVRLADLAREVGTPFYVYSSATLSRHFEVFRDALAAHADQLGDPLVAFAVKANSNLSVLATLARLGAGADTVSEGEIRRALKAGVPGDKIVFSGVGKTDAELAFALEAGVYQINVEAEPELVRLARIAADKGVRAPFVVRVNPKVGAGGHAKITTGGAGDKFGVDAEEALRLYAEAAATPSLRPLGLACHIGSQITDLGPLEAAFGVMRGLVERLRGQGLEVSRLDLGGGLGVPYFNQQEPPSPEAFAAMVARTVGGLDVRYVFEPGRMIVANAGVLVSRVIHIHGRPDGGRRFLVLDAAMNDLMRPALYDAFHDIRPVRVREGASKLAYDVVGPVCETGDTFSRDRELPEAAEGDLVAFMSAGAYGAVMGSEYNTRPLAPEVLVREGQWSVVRRRPTYDEIFAREPAAAWL
ncbi:diaminopimelate decarboxylase [Caulobacter sp. 17J80-11]|uniref:diaminopimelate decarboxylase n=1 Tax=Caulobacter sp. 17J80-11 TaxID=2763502 RepID=UPI0016538A9F|nr:diaminopimelate decarboxylase [Caulobacter sp. 17J80-11]